jgi:hypothetical protein
MVTEHQLRNTDLNSYYLFILFWEYTNASLQTCLSHTQCAPNVIEKYYIETPI